MTPIFLKFSFISEELKRSYGLLTENQITQENMMEAYGLFMKNIENEARNRDDRAYGGVMRMSKGWLVESIARHMVAIAWRELGRDENRLNVSKKRIIVPIEQGHLSRLPEGVRKHIQAHIRDFVYRCEVDVHVVIDGKFVMAIECKAFTENAMLKRNLIDFSLVKTRSPDLLCYVLLQLESQLGGDYSDFGKEMVIGSRSTRTLESYFPSVNLKIITLLEGERKVKQPIHQPRYFKNLKPDLLRKAIVDLQEMLEKF